MNSLFAGCGGTFREAIDYDHHPPDDVLEQYIHGELPSRDPHAIQAASHPEDPTPTESWDEHTVAVHVMTCEACERYVTERKYRQLRAELVDPS